MSHTTAAALPPSTLAQAAWGVRTQFFVAGALFATWGVHVPTVKAHYGLGEQALAGAMLCAGVGALLALTQAGRLTTRHGPRSVTWVSGLLATALMTALLAMGHPIGLWALMLAYGFTTSLFDVAINAEATEIERLAGRPLMSGFHGMFSLGGMAGAAAGSALLSAGVAPQQHLLGAGVAGALAVLAGASVMLRMPGGGDEAPRFSLPRGALVWIGLLAAAGLVAEGAMYDWSVLYLKQELRADAGTAALAYASFSAAMAAGRFGGDWVRSHLSSVTVLRASGALGAAGMALALLAPHPVVALGGFTLVGLGFANIVPVLFGAAAKVPGVSPAHGIAAVSSVAWLGMMAGPPLIGLVAEHSSLTLGLTTVVVFALLLAAAARRALSA